MVYSKNASLCTDHFYKMITYDYQNLNCVELQKNQNEDKKKGREMEEKKMIAIKMEKLDLKENNN